MKHQLELKGDQAWYKNHALVVVGKEKDKRALLEIYHDSPAAGHPGQSKALAALRRDYWWPEMRTFVQGYVRGCAYCQESKPITHPNRPLVQPIYPKLPSRPFSTISIDFIVKLPVSQGYDSVLNITDHDCTKAVILLPCKEEMDSVAFAKLYLKCVFPFIGISQQVISDRDPCFTSKIF
jgi:hypothetical protein